MQVRFYAALRSVVGGKTVEVPVLEGCTLGCLVDELIERYPSLRQAILNEKGEVSRAVHIFVNGRSSTYLQDGLATLLSPDDRVDVIPAAAGG